jgi:hypothetical protein
VQRLARGHGRNLRSLMRSSSSELALDATSMLVYRWTGPPQLSLAREFGDDASGP